MAKQQRARGPVGVMTLIGYRGSGKSSVARALAERLGWQAVDADTEIERRAGMSIRQLFERHGEAEFRRIERDVMQELLKAEKLVIAAGGGAVLDPQTRRTMRKAGPVVWLQAPVDVLEARIAGDPTSLQRRPNLTSSGGRAEIERLLAEREPLYRECATMIIDTNGRTVEEIAEEIIERLQDRSLFGEP